MKVHYDTDAERKVPVALEVWDALQRIAPKGMKVAIRRFDNCREQGYCVTAGDRAVSFAENRNSDDIVVYHGGAKSFDDKGCPTSDLGWKRAEYFRWNRQQEAAEAILGLLTSRESIVIK